AWRPADVGAGRPRLPAGYHRNLHLVVLQTAGGWARSSQLSAAASLERVPQLRRSALGGGGRFAGAVPGGSLRAGHGIRGPGANAASPRRARSGNGYLAPPAARAGLLAI